MTPRVSLASQAAAVRTVARLPASTIGRAVGLEYLGGTRADLLQSHLMAAAATLALLAPHEAELRALLLKKGGGE